MIFNEYKQLKAKTDIEKCEIFKTLLQDTMKDHTYKNLELNEQFEKVENETKMLLQYENTEPNNYCILKVDDYEEILSKTRRSSPGPDKISYNILKRLPKCLKTYISLLITSSQNNSYVPTTWKELQVKMLPKPNKNKKAAENYRPISLTNCIANICETAVKNFVLARCEEKNVFGEKQSAYRRNRCTTDNLLKLTQHVAEAFQWSEMVGFVCLDIEKAFDAVWRLGLQNKLLQIAVHKPLIKWVNSFLSQRSIFVKINNSKSSTFSTLARVPQGSVIGRILFLVIVSGIPEIPAQISQFADDFAFHYRSRSSRIIQEKPQYSLDKLIKWCEKLKIRINPGNTNFMLLKNPSKKVSSLDHFINGKKIEGANSIKFLGGNLNPHLKWNQRFKSLVARANKKI